MINKEPVREDWLYFCTRKNQAKTKHFAGNYQLTRREKIGCGAENAAKREALLVVFAACLDGLCTVNLLQNHDPCKMMGEGHRTH